MATRKFVREIIQRLTRKVLGRIEIEVDLDGDGEPDKVALNKLNEAALKLAKTVKTGSKVTIVIDFSGKD
jgi:hypothetical protein